VAIIRPFRECVGPRCLNSTYIREEEGPSGRVGRLDLSGESRALEHFTVA